MISLPLFLNGFQNTWEFKSMLMLCQYWKEKRKYTVEWIVCLKFIWKRA